MSLLRATLDYDPLTKTRTVFHEMDDDKYVIETVADVEDLIEVNKAKYNSVDERARWTGHDVVASLPMHVYFDLLKRGIIDKKGNGRRSLWRWLDDPENLYWRTRPGKLSR